MRIFSPKYFARLSCNVHASVSNLAPRNFGEFTMRNLSDTGTNHECRATVLRHSHNSLKKTCEHLVTIWRENKTKRHSYECLATVVGMKMKISYNRGKVMRHSHECLTTVMRQSCDYRTTVVRYIFKIRLKFANLHNLCKDYIYSESIFKTCN